ncbi:MAG: efflux RND transporter permease subunit [Gammaproteobacteria bacterium]|nr:efflux RND transporter permease subunit [Gammaproteobacteria bacterium]
MPQLTDKNRRSGLAGWSIKHPIGVLMLTLATMVLGLFSLFQLHVNLLPELVYPDIRVRVLSPGVAANVMEQRITNQLEEQLAITEGVIAITSRSSEGRSAVDLSFAYGTDIDRALRDASTRLDRAKRFLPNNTEAPVIYKRDPSQIAVLEYVLSSDERSRVELSEWLENDFSNWFLNLAGVAATEVGGALQREILIQPDSLQLAELGLDLLSLQKQLQADLVEPQGGFLQLSERLIGTHLHAPLKSLAEIRQLPIRLKDGTLLPLATLATVIESQNDERLRIRLNGINGIKLSIQKQPQANSVAVADAVEMRLAELRQQNLLPSDIKIVKVADQARFVRLALNNASMTALSGALLAMLVVYLFLGDLRRTLIIGSAIPIAILITFILMSLADLSLNIMTLGGLALGIGLLVDNTIVMLENISRHQQEQKEEAALSASHEISGALLAATSTNLAAVLPFLFVGGLVGLLFRELIFTISAAILASLLVALTLVPALAAPLKQRQANPLARLIAWLLTRMQNGHQWALHRLLNLRWLVIPLFVIALAYSLPPLLNAKQSFLPKMDNGQISVSLSADPGTNLEAMDRLSQGVEKFLLQQPEVKNGFATIGGFVFGRSQYQSPNRTSIQLQLKKGINSQQWIKQIKTQLKAKKRDFIGLKIRLRSRGIRGIRLSRGNNDLNLYLQGNDLETLSQLGDKAIALLKPIKGLKNLQHSAEERHQELTLIINRQRAAELGLSLETIGQTLQMALQGRAIGTLYQQGQAISIRLRLPASKLNDFDKLQQIRLLSPSHGSVTLDQLVTLTLSPTPAAIEHRQQRRVLEISASLNGDLSLEQALLQAKQSLQQLPLPKGYSLYDGGSLKTLQESQTMGQLMIGLALFLVLVVMAVQYESLRNPVVILLSVPFALIGVSLMMQQLNLPLSMPVWLGLIMLIGIVVNNAIVLLEQIELERQKGLLCQAAILLAARLRLRPILMTTLTTVIGMLPLALAWGEGSEMLRPLALTLVSGLSFSLLVSLLLVPLLYRVFAKTE